MKISNIKRTAKGKLSGNWGKTILTLIFYGIIEGIVHSIINGPVNYHYFGSIVISSEQQQQFPGGPLLIVTLLSAIISFILSYGLVVYFMNLVRNEDASYTDIFYYIRNGSKQFFRAIISGILVTVFLILWTFLFVIPGIIKGLAYSQVPYIIKDQPEMKPLDAITLSRRMMNGYKWKYLLLNLSLILWFIIPVAILIAGGFSFINSAGVGILLLIIGILSIIGLSFYVVPYYYASLAQFHEEVKAAYEEREDIL